MLRPNKHSHPDKTVINVTLLILARLRDRRVEKYQLLRDYVKRAVTGADVLFLPALNLLFLLGLVEYRVKTDSFEYTGPNDAV